MVERAARQVGDLRAVVRYARLPRLVMKAHHRVGIGHVEILAHERHAIRRVETFEERRAKVDDSVAVAVTQKRDAIRASVIRAGALLHDLVDPPFDPFAVLGLRRRVGLGNQDVAVRQHIHRTRMLKSVGESLDLQSLRSDRLRILRPAFGRRDVDCGNDRLRRLGQRRIRPLSRRKRKLRHVPAARKGYGDHGRARCAKHTRCVD